MPVARLDWQGLEGTYPQGYSTNLWISFALVKLSTGRARCARHTHAVDAAAGTCELRRAQPILDPGKKRDALTAYDCHFGPFRALCAQTEEANMPHHIAVIVGSLRRDSTNSGSRPWGKKA
jgi:hypothetical protein